MGVGSRTGGCGGLGASDTLKRWALVRGGTAAGFPALYVISAAAAWLVAGAMTLEHSFGRAIIPLGK
ncbi:MAG: hypothetical protein ACM3ML_01575 [Micromonosporaceae bacterium]